jgi:hypothetical protein
MTNNDIDHDLRDTFRRHEQDVLGHGPTPSPSLFRRIRRRQTGTVLMSAVAAAAIAIAGISGLDALRASEQTPAVPGSETGPTETGGENPEPPPVVEPVPIGTVTRSGGGCELEIVAEPIPSGAGRIRVVNKTHQRVSFELVLLRSGSTFGQFEAFVAEAKAGFWGSNAPKEPRGAFYLAIRDVGPSAAGTITDNFSTGAFAVVCLDHDPFNGFFVPDYKPFAVVGPIVVS